MRRIIGALGKVGDQFTAFQGHKENYEEVGELSRKRVSRGLPCRVVGLMHLSAAGARGKRAGTVTCTITDAACGPRDSRSGWGK